MSAVCQGLVPAGTAASRAGSTPRALEMKVCSTSSCGVPHPLATTTYSNSYKNASCISATLQTQASTLAGIPHTFSAGRRPRSGSARRQSTVASLPHRKSRTSRKERVSPSRAAAAALDRPTGQDKESQGDVFQFSSGDVGAIDIAELLEKAGEAAKAAAELEGSANVLEALQAVDLGSPLSQPSTSRSPASNSKTSKPRSRKKRKQTKSLTVKGVSVTQRRGKVKKKHVDTGKEIANKYLKDVAAMEKAFALETNDKQRSSQVAIRNNSASIAARAAAVAKLTTPNPKLKKRAAKSNATGGDGGLYLYMKEIAQVTLLTADEEVSLAHDIKLQTEVEALQTDLESTLDREPTDAEVAESMGISVVEMRKRVSTGKESGRQLVSANLRLVVNIAKQYMGRGMSFTDLIQEGSLGLLKAAAKFDLNRGYRFSTYAHWWIRQAITRCIADNSRTIRLPVHMIEMLGKISKARASLAVKLQRDPSDAEISAVVGIPEEKVRSLIKASWALESVDADLSNGDDGDNQPMTLGDTLEDDHEEIPDTQSENAMMQLDFEMVLNTLTQRERDVLTLRFGISGEKQKTLEEIGKMYDVTRERVRQIEAKALRKMRQPQRHGMLRDYLESNSESLGFDQQDMFQPVNQLFAE